MDMTEKGDVDSLQIQKDTMDSLQTEKGDKELSYDPENGSRS